MIVNQKSYCVTGDKILRHVLMLFYRNRQFFNFQVDAFLKNFWVFFCYNLMDYDRKYLKNIVSDWRQNSEWMRIFFEKNRHFLKIFDFRLEISRELHNRFSNRDQFWTQLSTRFQMVYCWCLPWNLIFQFSDWSNFFGFFLFKIF